MIRLGFLLALLFITPSTAAVLESPDGSTTQIADRPPKTFADDRWIFVCIETDPPTTIYLCRYYDKREM